MNDRELLVLAAKAAGIKPPHGQGGYISRDGGFCYYLDCEGKTSRIWNPLKDDGDALRLGVALGIDVQHFAETRMTEAWKHPHQACVEDYGSDPGAATRRAIVRAAAAIGESMP